jgi:RNA polymerase sigma-70 factor (ECF subfamily)
MSGEAEKRARFDALARRYSADLFRFGLWLCGNEALAKDLMQETFLRAWRALESLQDDGAAKSWLITIFRREYARTFERKTPPLTDLDSVVVEDRESLAPDEKAERGRLRQAMRELDRRYREPLLLQIVMGYSIREIAGTLELTESAVMTQLFRAREQLKEKLQADGVTGNIHGLF